MFYYLVKPYVYRDVRFPAESGGGGVRTVLGGFLSSCPSAKKSTPQGSNRAPPLCPSHPRGGCPPAARPAYLHREHDCLCSYEGPVRWLKSARKCQGHNINFPCVPPAPFADHHLNTTHRPCRSSVRYVR